MKRWAKRLGWGLLGLVGLVLLLVVAALVVLQTEWGGRRILRDEVLARVNDSLMGELTADRIRLIGGTLTLEGVALRDPDGELVAEIERLRASVALSALLRRRVEVKELVVERPGLYVVADAEGTNLQRALEPKEPKPEEPEKEPGELPADLVLREARIEDGHLSFVSRTGAEPFEAEATDLDLTASASLLERGDAIDARLELGARVKAPLEGPARVTVSANGRREAMNVSVDGDVAGAKLQAKATVEPEVERLVATIERLEVPPSVVRAFSEAYPLKVAVRGEGTLKREGPEVTADLTVRAGSSVIRAEAKADLERKWAESVEMRGERIDLSQLVEGGPKSDVAFHLSGRGGGTSAETLEGELRLSAPVSKMGGQPFGPIEVLARAQDGTWVLERLEAVVPGLALTARGRGDKENVQLYARLAAKDLSAFARTLGTLAGPEGLPVAGQGGMALRVEGPVAGPAVRVSGRFPFLRYDQNRLRELRLSATVDDVRDPLSQNVAVDLRAQSATVGERVLQAPAATLSLKERKLAFDARTRGSLRLDLSGQGAVDEDARGVRLTALNLRYPEAQWALEKPAAVRFEETLLLVDGLSLRAGEQRLSVTARRTPRTLDADVRVENLALARLPKDVVTLDEPLGGTLNVALTAEGAADDPALTVKGALKDARYGDITGVNLDVDARWAKERATGEAHAEALGARARLDFDVPVRALRTGAAAPLSASLELDEVSLAEVARALGQAPQAEGRLTAKAELRGTARAPRLDAKAEVRSLVAGEHPPIDLAFRVDGAEGGKLRARLFARVDEPEATEDAEPSQLTLQTPWTLARLIRRPPTAEQALRAPIVLTGALRRLPVPYEDPSRPLETQRRFARLSGTVDVRGAALDPRGEVALDLEEFGAGELYPLDVAMTLNLDRARQLLTAKVNHGEKALLDATARIDAPVASLRRTRALRTAPIAVKLEAGPVGLNELQDFQKRPVVQPGEPTPPRLRGILHATLEASGNLDAPVVDGGLSIHGLGAQEAVGVGDLSIRFDHKGGSSHLAADLLSQGGELALRIASPLKLSLAALEQGFDPSKLPLHGSLRAKDFDPGFLSGISPKLLEVGGRMNAEADLTGHVGLPRVKGELSWDDGVVALFGQGRYHDIRVRVSGSDEAVKLEEAFARSGKGTARLTASLTRSGEEAEVRAEAKLEDFPVVSDFQRVATVSLRAEAEGKASVEQITVSRLHVPEAHVVLPSTARRDLHALAPPEGIAFYYDGKRLEGGVEEAGAAPEKTPKDLPGQPVQRGGDETGVGGAAQEGEVAGVTPGAKPPQGPPDEAARTRLMPRVEIHLDAPRNLWVRGDDLNVEVGFGPDFRVEVEDEPLLFGDVLVRRGRVDVFGRRFDLSDESRVTFTGPLMEPRLNVVATHENRREEVLVTLRVTGQGKDLEIQPSSEPPLTETEIYTLIATGRRSLQSGGRSSGAGNAATSVLGSLATAQLQQGLRKVIPLDILSIEQGESGVGSARVEAGTYLTDRLYLGIASQIGAELDREENRNELHLEYELWKRWVLDLEYGDAREGGADLLWRKRY